MTKPKALWQKKDLPNNGPDCLSFFYKGIHLKLATMDKKIKELQAQTVAAAKRNELDRAKVLAESIDNIENKKQELENNEKVDEEC